MALRISIPKPCTVKSTEFYPDGKGYTCDLCEKEVTNFTRYTDRELFQYLKENPRPGCGIFRKDQLDKNIKDPTKREFKLSSLILSGLLLTAEMCLAQNEDSLSTISSISDTTAITDISPDSLTTTNDDSANSNIPDSSEIVQISADSSPPKFTWPTIYGVTSVIIYGGFMPSDPFDPSGHPFLYPPVLSPSDTLTTPKPITGIALEQGEEKPIPKPAPKKQSGSLWDVLKNMLRPTEEDETTA